MGALIKACKSTLTVKNTGIECNDSMGPTAMLFAVPPGLSWPKSALADFHAYLSTQIHGAKGSRIYPLFGPAAPIRRIVNSKESDVLFTAEDGTQIFIRYGVLNRAFGTTEGGLCYAQALASFTKAGFSFLEVDNAGQILMRKNSDGTYSGLKTTFMFAPSIDLADFKNPAFSNFQVSVKPEEYINHGQIFSGDSTITDLVGLLDTDVKQNAAANSTTKLKIDVVTECGETDLVALLGSALALVANFAVFDNATPGTPVVPSAAAVVGGHIELTGTYVTGHTYTVALVASPTLLTNGLDGYEGVGVATCLIP